MKTHLNSWILKRSWGCQKIFSPHSEHHNTVPHCPTLTDITSTGTLPTPFQPSWLPIKEGVPLVTDMKMKLKAAHCSESTKASHLKPGFELRFLTAKLIHSSCCLGHRKNSVLFKWINFQASYISALSWKVHGWGGGARDKGFHFPPMKALVTESAVFTHSRNSERRNLTHKGKALLD